MPADNTEEIKLKTGDTTTISLKGLATAGYEWNYTIDTNNDFVTVSKDYQFPDKLNQKNIGASADEIFTIRANKKGIVNIYFFQKRSWETNVKPVNEKRVAITIE